MGNTTQTIAVQQPLVRQQAMEFLVSLRGIDLTSASIVELDLSQVSELDASGMAVLVRLYSQLRAAGVTLKIENATTTLAAEFERVGFAAIVPVGVRVPRPTPASTRPLPA